MSLPNAIPNLFLLLSNLFILQKDFNDRVSFFKVSNLKWYTKVGSYLEKKTRGYVIAPVCTVSV